MLRFFLTPSCLAPSPILRAFHWAQEVSFGIVGSQHIVIMSSISILIAISTRASSHCKPCSRLRHCRLFSFASISKEQPLPTSPLLSSSPTLNPFELPLSHPIYTIWGSNTGVGKTLVSAGIASSILSPTSSAARKSIKLTYIKPVQTGFPSDSDSYFVYRKVSDIFLRRKARGTLLASNCTMKVSCSAAREATGSDIDTERTYCELKDMGCYEGRRLEGEGCSRELISRTLCAWREAVSPHLAAQRENWVLDDTELLEMVQRCLWTGLNDCSYKKVENWSILETSGGVASPGPSGSLQSDLYRPFRLPAILVGDGRLGGISGTISAYESLKLRGYDVVAIVLEDHGLTNESSLLSYLRNSMPVLVLPPVPQDMSDDLMQWYEESWEVFNSLKKVMLLAFSERVQRLHDMPKKARDVFWWPFTQHQLVPGQSVTVIDSRCGENFAVHKIWDHDQISQQFDACASWWTQGPDYALQIELARDMGYTAARYGHVMFPENVHEPALRCAELLLDGVGKGWASRAFFSDNGSTAIEIALKMAFRKFLVNHNISLDFHKNNEVEAPMQLKVLALKGSYHGDTLGAMEAQAPSSYTGFLQQPWYTGKGLFIDPPMVHMHDGTWKLTIPEGFYPKDGNLDELSFGSRDEVFLVSRDRSSVARSYLSYISEQLLPYTKGDILVGALIIEPVIHAAGGMVMIDPLFQRILVKICQRHKIPVIFDEVFTGFWRLGAESAGELLHCSPDIACYAKLMTGGIIPLSATLATEDTFNAFMGQSKLKALLHGHSYTAHAMGCTAAVKAIKWFKDPTTNINISSECKSLRELWDVELVQKMSSHPAVKRLVVLGTLCAVELQATGSDAGYASLYASSLLQKLREDGIFMRPLGNVIYLMCGPCTAPDTCGRLLLQVYRRIDDWYGKNSAPVREVSLSC